MIINLNSFSIKKMQFFIISFIFIFTILFNYTFAQVIGDNVPDFWPSLSANNSQANNDTMGVVLSDESVDLYTGQHSETIPLMSIDGRGGLKLDLFLKYCGMVKDIATSQNYQKQASPFGLGFRLNMSTGLEYIQVDHNNTAYISDDKYILIMNGIPCGLRSIGNNNYIPENGNPWIIKRYGEYDTEDSLNVVTGFDVITEDGTCYQMGDLNSDPEYWNATQNIARFKQDVRAGIRANDEVDLYPHEWYLKSIHDVEYLNSIEFTYMRDSFLVGTGVNNYYATRATYIKEIESSNGQKIMFSYVDRGDYQPFYDSSSNYSTGLYDFYYKKRIDNIKLLSSSGDTITTKQFLFDSLNFNYESSHSYKLKKLLLSSLKTFSKNKTDSLPPYIFEYYCDSLSNSLGSIRRVIYPSGMLKEIHYKTIDDDSNFSQLHFFVDTLPTNRSGFICLTSVGNNLILYCSTMVYDELPLKHGYYWDGYWRELDDFEENATYQWEASPWNKNLFVYTLPDIKKYVVRRWMGGYWNVDTLDMIDQNYGFARIIPDNNGFLALHSSNIIFDRAKTIYYYRWNGENWHGFHVATITGERQWNDIKIFNGVFAISIRDSYPDDDSYFYLGKYDYDLDSIISLYHGQISNYNLSETKFTVGTDVVALIDKTNCYIYHYLSNGWQWDITYTSDPVNSTYSITSFPFGIIWSYKENDEDIHLNTLLYTDDFYEYDSLDILDPDGYLDLKASNHTLISRSHSYEWYNNMWNDCSSYSSQKGDIYPDAKYFIDTINNLLYPRFYLGRGNWHSTSSHEINSVGTSQDILIADYATTSNSGRCIYTWDPFYCGFTAYDELDSLGEIGGQWAGPVSSQSIINNTIAVFSSFCTGGNCPTLFDLYKYVDRKYEGKPNINVVDKIIKYNSLVDDNPIVKTYDYYATLIDQNETPRFGKVTVSLPYFKLNHDTISFIEYHFYNDIDDDNFYDENIYDGTYFPDLSSASTYGIENGGYHLDGKVYLTDSYTKISGDPDTYIYDRDTTKYYYFLYPTPDNLFNIYRIELDKLTKQKDGVTSETIYKYNEINGLVSSIRTKVANEIWRIDSIYYAYQYYPSMYSDNAISQISYHSIWDSNSTTYTKSILDYGDMAYYNLNGRWQPDSIMNYLIDEYELITNYKVINWDDFGNVIDYKNVLNINHAIKYDSIGNNVIATGANCTNNDMLIQNFEYGSYWDSWVCRDDSSEYISFDTNSFTGQYSIKLIDNNNNNYGPYRYIDVEDLSDSIYYFTCWVYTNHYVAVLCQCLDSLNDTCSGGNYLEAFLSIPANTWTKIEGTFDLSDQINTVCLDKIKIQLILEWGNGGYAYIDDFRFQPVEALVTSSVYNPQNNLLSSGMDYNNVPTNYKYDGLQRNRATLDYNNQLLDSTNLYYMADSLSLYHYWNNNRPSGTSDTLFRDTLYFDSSFTCKYVLELEYNSGSPVGLRGLLKKNEEWLSQFWLSYYDDYERDTGTVEVEPGDIITIWYVSENESDYVNLDIIYWSGSLPEYPPKQPSWQEKKIYRDEDDYSDFVTFYDPRGNKIRERSYYNINGSDTLTVVKGWVYNALDRISKTYKPYYDSSPGKSVFNFNYDSFENEDSAYYSEEGEGPNCGGKPFIEYRYEYSFPGRAIEIKPEGSYSNHPVMYDYGSSEATISGFTSSYYGIDSLYKLKTTDENGNIFVTYKDKNENTIGVVQDSITNGINLYTRFYKNFRGKDTLIIQPEGYNIINRYNCFGWLMFDSSGDYGFTQNIYDKAGNLRFTKTSVDRYYNRYLYNKYDAHNRLIEHGLINGDTTSMTWDNAKDVNFPTSSDNPVILSRYEYDNNDYSRGKLSKAITYPAGVNPDSASWEEYYYDEYGRVARKEMHVYVVNTGSSEREIEVSYNLQGQPTQITYNNEKYVDYTYNKAGQVTKVVDDNSLFQAQFDYWPSGQVKTKDLGTTVETIQTVDYAYNPRDWLLTINNGSAGSSDSDFYGLALAYDTLAYKGYCDTIIDTLGDTSYVYEYANAYYNGNIASYNLEIGKDLSQSTIQNYAYDNIDHIKAEDYLGTLGSDLEFRYYYDDNGNIEEIRKHDSTLLNDYIYWQGTNRLKGINGDSNFTYTRNGAIQKYIDTNMNMVYNFDNRLVNRWMPSAWGQNKPNSVFYSYNTREQRVSKTYRYWYGYYCGDTSIIIRGLEGGSTMGSGGGGGDSCYKTNDIDYGYYYLNNDMLFDYNGPAENDLIGNYVYVNGERIAKFKTNSDDVIFYLTDHLGSIVATFLADTLALHSKDYYRPFGEKISSWIVGEKDKYNYTSQELDEDLEIDWYYYGARYYDPVLKIFPSPDPLSTLNPGWSPYVYTLDNPIKYTDPDGNIIKPIGSENFIQLVEATRIYLFLRGVNTYDELNNREEVVELVETNILKGDGFITTGRAQYFSRNPNANAKIEWNPYSALRTEDGGTQSPALGLVHELGEALLYLNNPEEYVQRGLSILGSGKWYTENERIVITRYENPAAFLLRENPRSEHSGTPYWVTSPISREPISIDYILKCIDYFFLDNLIE